MFLSQAAWMPASAGMTNCDAIAGRRKNDETKVPVKRVFLTAAILSLLFLPQEGIGEESSPILLKAVIPSDGRTLFQIQVQPQDSICLRTIHSLALTPYAHFYRMDEDGNLILSSAEYESGGGGYPESGDGVFSVVNGKFRMEGINSFIGRLRFRVSPVSRETLIVSGQEFRLYQMVPEGTSVEVSVRKERRSF